MRVLIQGAGPAGLTLALALKKNGISSIVLERASKRRSDGYAVGLHVNGFAALRHLGIADVMPKHALPLAISRHYDVNGRKHLEYDYRLINKQFEGEAIALMRDNLLGELEQACKENNIVVRYNCKIERLVEHECSVEVELSDGKVEQVDIAIGTDGFRSSVRKLCFGPHEDFIVPLGYRVAAWTVQLSQPLKQSVVGVMDVDHQASLYDLGDGQAATLFCWCDEAKGHLSAEEKYETVKRRFGCFGDVVAEAVEAADWGMAFFDDVSIVQMPTWHRNRVALLGDAAWAMTFLSGQSTSSAMAGAVKMANLLAMKSHEEAFQTFDREMRPIVSRQQEVARKIGGQYVPQSRWGMWLQKYMLAALLSRPLLPLTLGRMMPKKIAL